MKPDLDFLFTGPRVSTALRAWLCLMAFLFSAFLLLVNDARVESERQYPHYAHLGWPMYIAIMVGFVPVFLGIAQVWRFVALAGQGAGHSPRAVAALRNVTRCALAVSAWFTAGVFGWGIATQGMDPPFITFWLAVNIPTWFVILSSALLTRVMEQRG
jgi:hypothetical protein